MTSSASFHTEGGWRTLPRGTGVNPCTIENSRGWRVANPSARHRNLLQARLKLAGCRTLRRVKGSGFDLTPRILPRLQLLGFHSGFGAHKLVPALE
jgi:hypothetical protein